jgi:DNA-binding GntR family transcriptional regulator
LVERELSERFGVSSIPIREALQELENRGLVTKRPNHGCSVINLTTQEVERICDLRRVLEPKVAEWAAGRITPGEVRELEQQLGRVSQAADAGDFSGFFLEDLVFHRRIWEISGNTYAARALESALGSLFASGLIRANQSDGPDLQWEVKKHERLLEALRRHDGRQAARALLEIAQGFEIYARPEEADPGVSKDSDCH